jgi:hypothetical protein
MTAVDVTSAARQDRFFLDLNCNEASERTKIIASLIWDGAIMKIMFILYLIATPLMLFGCTTTLTDTIESNDLQDAPIISTNIVKVLNSVRCHEDYRGYCPQSIVNALWERCLEVGYETRIPNSEIRSSRSISELVTGDINEEVTKSTITESTDASGVVTQTESPYTTTQTYLIKGYCDGSEYIKQ